MKFIQLMAFTLAAMFIFSISAVAQPGQGGGQGQGRAPMSPEQRKAQMEKMATDLALTEEQKASYFKLEEDFSGKMQSMRSESQGDPTAMREGMMKMRQERDESLKALLNEDQLAKYEGIMANRQNMRGPRGQGQAQPAQEKEKASKGKGKKKGKKKKEGDGDN